MRRPLGARSAGSRRLLSGRSAGPRRLSAQHPGRTGAAPQAHRGVYIDSFGSFVLNYAYAEHLEKAELKKDQRDFTEVYNVYDRFFGVLRANLARLSVVPEPETPAQEPTADANDELSERKKQYSNAWINYMRFARRAQGHKACRDAFGKARKDPFVGWEVYEAAGVSDGISLHMDDGRSVAARIFETGMKMFGYDVAYVLSHLSFLLTVNDENNARALFERVIGTFPPAEAKPIWERWSRSQYQYDDLEAVLELERRMAEVYPNDAPIKRFGQRHTYHSIDAIADNDLGFATARKFASVPGINAPSVPPANLNGTDNKVVTSSLLTMPNPNNPNKRPPPPPDRKRENDYKRQRADERERTRRYSPPPPTTWSRDRDMKQQPPPRRDPPREKEDKPVALPPVLNWFIQQLPPPTTFDGPVFNTENLMDKSRTAVIPSSSARARSPPPQPPPRSSGRPPPDYGPYQGPQSMPRGGRGRY
ncbi:hypothetical protein C8R43DRAFT_1245229 [Mycena crocata]|nr:hypothetical protein C8R43DRAFT_1245229 [Mycena crocata]